MSKALLRKLFFSVLILLLIAALSGAGSAQSFVLDLPDQSQRAEI